MGELVALGPTAADALREVSADTGAGALRVPALLTMAFSRDTSHTRSLQALCADKDPVIRREALTALTKVDPRSALDDARRLLSDPDETVAMAAGEAYRMLGGKAAEPSPRGEASLPPTPAAAPKAGSGAAPGPAKAAPGPAKASTGKSSPAAASKPSKASKASKAAGASAKPAGASGKASRADEVRAGASRPR